MWGLFPRKVRINALDALDHVIVLQEFKIEKSVILGVLPEVRG